MLRRAPMVVISAICLLPFTLVAADESAPNASTEVSYYKQIRPIFQANCQGCHQPAKQGGDFMMTSVTAMTAEGAAGMAGIVPGDPAASYLLDQITPVDGQAEMPKGKAPLTEAQIALVRQWIAEGAVDDTPANAQRSYDADHPPTYTRPPVVASIDYSPSGDLLAVAGFHEVLMHKADGSGIVDRLIGVSERVEAVAFSPDGNRLAVAAGNPSRTGELQIWKRPAEGESRWSLESSIPVTDDTIYGAAWSPDGKMVVVGCTDSTVRGFDIASGDQVFFSGAHDDWVLDTVVSADGSQIVSVGRDMATKLYDVKTQRFIDNVTSITPGALKGGISALARHPERDEVLVGGSDGTPRIYRMNRVTKRVIGDDANLIRRFEGMKGRLFGAAYAPDGKSVVCAATLDGRSQVSIYSAEFNSEMPEDIQGIVQKTTPSQSADEKKRLEEWVTSEVQTLHTIGVPAAIFTLAYKPDGSAIATCGADGIVRLINPADGSIIGEFPAAEVSSDAALQATEVAGSSEDVAIPEDRDVFDGQEQLPPPAAIGSLVIEPAQLNLQGPNAYGQIGVSAVAPEVAEQITAKYDVTRLADLTIVDGSEVAAVNEIGRVVAKANGVAVLKATLGDRTAELRIHVNGIDEQQPVSFIRDVNPILSRLGCNQGTCHGAKDGKNGFKLSLRGYDPVYDVRAFTDDLKSRRTNIAVPDDSLMLLKATGAAPHVGGQLTTPGHPYYETIRRWIAEGGKLDLDVPKVASVTVAPENPIIQRIGDRQQMRVYARYTNGEMREVTREAFIESGNTEVATVNRAGIVTAIRRGEAPVMVRFEGAYAATTITSMGNREGYEYQPPETWTGIDELVAAKWKRMKIAPSGLCSDEEFIRRVYLDVTGLPPTADEVRAFVNDDRPVREKRDELVDKLVGSPEYVTYWSNKWADLLQVNRKFLGVEGAKLFRDWIREQVAANRPYDQFSYDILTATGSNKENPPASYYKVLRDSDVMMENTTHLFLAVRFNCNKCHDHPFERWTQDQYYETAAFFAQVGLQRDPNNKDGNIGGTAVEGAKPLWEVVMDRPDGEIKHDRTGAVTAPLVPYDRDVPISEAKTRREQLAKWITSPDNDLFARSYANRVWGYLMGVGLIEPLDDIRAGNPPSNPELLDYLEDKFVESGFDVQSLIKAICKSRTYQLSVATNPLNEDDQLNYSHAVPKRLPAEVLFDAVHTVTGADMKIPGVPPGTRAAALPDVGVELSDNFLANLGRPTRESACECERTSELQLGPVMALMNGPTVSGAISQPDNAIAQLARSEMDDAKVIDELFMRILNRPARSDETAAAMAVMEQLQTGTEQLKQELAAYAQKIAPVTAAKEAKRQENIDAAQAAYDAYWASIKEREEAAEAARLAKIAAAKKAVDDHVAGLPAKLAAWEQQISTTGTIWQVLDPVGMNASTGATLTKEDDLSIFVTGPNDKQGNYTVSARTDLSGITGIKLELLADPRLPMNGPGRAPNGNFVLTEFGVQAWPQGQPNDKKPVKLVNAKADFSQEGYDVATAIDGKQNANGNGWATSPDVGKNRTATFELEQPLAHDGGTILHFAMSQNYSGKDHTIGRFRISVTTAAPPLTEGLSDELLAILKVPADQRDDAQKTKLLEEFQQMDAELQQLNKALAAAEQPRPEDPQLVSLRAALEEAKLPLPEDPQLVRLQRAVRLSEEQLQNDRLTIAQDLAWALINSPAFLFNR